MIGVCDICVQRANFVLRNTLWRVKKIRNKSPISESFGKGGKRYAHPSTMKQIKSEEKFRGNEGGNRLCTESFETNKRQRTVLKWKTGNTQGSQMVSLLETKVEREYGL